MTNAINFLDLFMVATMLMPLFAVAALLYSEKPRHDDGIKRTCCYAIQGKDGVWRVATWCELNREVDGLTLVRL